MAKQTLTSGVVKHWVQYHTPEWMGCGVQGACGPTFSAFTDKTLDDPRGDVVWLVGIKDDGRKNRVYLRYWFVVDDVQSGQRADFIFELVGQHGRMVPRVPLISNQPWFRDLLGMTRNFKHGLTPISWPSVFNGLNDVAQSKGAGWPE
jgi:hypothetical protein